MYVASHGSMCVASGVWSDSLHVHVASHVASRL